MSVRAKQHSYREQLVAPSAEDLNSCVERKAGHVSSQGVQGRTESTRVRHPAAAPRCRAPNVSPTFPRGHPTPLHGELQPPGGYGTSGFPRSSPALRLDVRTLTARGLPERSPGGPRTPRRRTAAPESIHPSTPSRIGHPGRSDQPSASGAAPRRWGSRVQWACASARRVLSRQTSPVHCDESCKKKRRARP